MTKGSEFRVAGSGHTGSGHKANIKLQLNLVMNVLYWLLDWKSVKEPLDSSLNPGGGSALVVLFQIKQEANRSFRLSRGRCFWWRDANRGLNGLSAALVVDELFVLGSLGSLMKWRPGYKTNQSSVRLATPVATRGTAGLLTVCDWLSEGHGWAEKQTTIRIRLMSVKQQNSTHSTLFYLLLFFPFFFPLLFLLPASCLLHWAPVGKKKKRKPHLWDPLQVCHMVEAGLICIPCRWMRNSAAAWLWSSGSSWICKLETKEALVGETLFSEKKSRKKDSQFIVCC